MNATERERKIQESQNIIALVDKTLIGLQPVYDVWGGDNDPALKIDELIIFDGEAKEYDLLTLRLEDWEIALEIKNAHNKYVTLLAEWQRRHSERLTKLLIL